MDRNQNENSPLAEKDPVDSQELFEPMTFYEPIVPEPSDLPEAMAFYKQVSPQRYALIHSMNSEEENLTPVLNQTESETELLFRPLVQVSFQDTIEELPALSTPTAPAGKLPNAVLPKNGVQMDAASVVPEIRKSLPSMEAARRFIARIPVISVGEELYAYRHLRYEKLPGQMRFGSSQRSVGKRWKQWENQLIRSAFTILFFRNRKLPGGSSIPTCDLSRFSMACITWKREHCKETHQSL